MYKPVYKLTNKLVTDLIKLELEKNNIENIETNTRIKNKLHKSSKALSIFHLAHMIGVSLTLKDAEKAADGKKLDTQDMRGIVLNNYRNALEYIRSNVASSYAEIDLNMLIHMNRLLLTGWKEEWEAKLRTDGSNFDETLDNFGSVVDTNFNTTYLQDEVLQALDWFKSSYLHVPDLVRIFALTYKLLRLAPFTYLNKLTILTITDFLLFKNGYVDKAHMSIIRNFDIYEQEYLEAFSYATENNDDITLWMERLVNNLINDFKDITDNVHKQIADDEKANKQPFLDLNKRQLKILRYLQTIPTVKREDYVQMMDVSTMTAFRDLSELVDKKLIRVDGKGRATKYMLYNR
ncbi:DeoR family transcriptional regulator [Candidatus Dojkabacteria bacterium]|uniref:DeoR family transcriptional regulator n=1 Tax=Candidatus Dojkabacteria bacterium TaxID=2099670 RepID=A0A955RJM0_9BACT|nr:DeoR family transcriptional regulator [Candidatus Dojkabacteria bacterium]